LLLWQQLYEVKLQALLAARPPTLPTSARELAEMIVTLIEGGFVMGNAYGDPGLLARQSRPFRQYLQLLFVPERAGRAGAIVGRPDLLGPTCHSA
jgi:TetR/AcrR family transcriptional regulator, transcriptional repressor for nem operon